MSVYFVQAEVGGPIKIGFCADGTEKARLAALQTGNPSPLVIRRLVTGDRAFEHRLHVLYRHLRMNGEWFWPAPELARLCGALDDLDLLEKREEVEADRVNAVANIEDYRRGAVTEDDIRAAFSG